MSNPQLQERIAQFRKMAQDDPDNELGHFRLGQLYMEDDQAQIVIDWKSDVKPTDSELEVHAAQLRVYMRATRAERGAPP